ncbi:hypothetical protein GCM10022415_09590 [Knoellia locipacati]|uniref:Uncharacterized protein n=1 Tax=Knoellia locipacati TaxID=882824 RepID=A0A512SY86_9MICO|nr:hypothetical protein [Knoellia locipacati]GEQ12910.1 hypothetical protein KLO01_09570 [Knoellia locipacati]
MRRAIATGALVIAAMGLGRVINDRIPTGDVADKPFVHSGSVGRAVSLDYADVTVTGVHVTPTVMGNPASAAGGRWLVVDTQMLATRRPTAVAGFFLVDARDRRWIASTRGPECAQRADLSTGVRHYASVCFDVPKKALEGARLMVTRGAWDSHEAQFRRDDLADIDLGIAASEVERLWASKDPVNVKESGPVPPAEARR